MTLTISKVAKVLAGQAFWISFGAIIATIPWTIAYSTWSHAIPAVLMAAVSAAIWGSAWFWAPFPNWRWRFVWFLASIPLALIVILYIVTIAGRWTQLSSMEKFNVERTAFLADPEGFPLLQKLAREQYGIEVVLANAYESWVSVIDTPSTASMLLGPGYCRLTMHRNSVLGGFNNYRTGQVDSSFLVQGVMMHEFAHCLDISRDMPAFDQKAIGTRSLAPEDAREVKNLEDHLKASQYLSTKLWREAVADIFVVGYWKLTAPEVADDLVDALRRKRTDEEGTLHATKCWIEHADLAPAPLSIAVLFEWADRLRTSGVSCLT